MDIKCSYTNYLHIGARFSYYVYIVALLMVMVYVHFAINYRANNNNWIKWPRRINSILTIPSCTLRYLLTNTTYTALSSPLLTQPIDRKYESGWSRSHRLQLTHHKAWVSKVNAWEFPACKLFSSVNFQGSHKQITKMLNMYNLMTPTNVDI